MRFQIHIEPPAAPGALPVAVAVALDREALAVLAAATAEGCTPAPFYRPPSVEGSILGARSRELYDPRADLLRDLLGMVHAWYELEVQQYLHDGQRGLSEVLRPPPRLSSIEFIDAAGPALPVREGADGR
jgi:hypothetical protein